MEKDTCNMMSDLTRSGRESEKMQTEMVKMKF